MICLGDCNTVHSILHGGEQRRLEGQGFIDIDDVRVA